MKMFTETKRKYCNINNYVFCINTCLIPEAFCSIDGEFFTYGEMKKDDMPIFIPRVIALTMNVIAST